MGHQQIQDSGAECRVDEQIMAFQRARPRMMFSDLAESLPSYTWHMLFCSLGRLSKTHRVELIPHRWDYEVIFLDGMPSGQSLSDVQHPDEQRGGNEKTAMWRTEG